METKITISISRQELLNKLQKMNFIIDVESNDIIIVRRSRFPFQRISIPKDEKISVELIKNYANDLNLPYKYFFSK